jgi:hypothetical protein
MSSAEEPLEKLVSKKKRKRRYQQDAKEVITKRLRNSRDARLRLLAWNHSLEFVVQGTTGNEYQVKLSSKPTCTCPDHQDRHVTCKHIIFILCRKFLMSETHVCFQHCQKNAQIELDEKELKSLTALELAYQDFQTLEQTKMRPITADSNCPICFEPFLVSGENKLAEKTVYCSNGCGQPVHETCFRAWQKKSTTCVYCRQPFPDPPLIYSLASDSAAKK